MKFAWTNLSAVRRGIFVENRIAEDFQLRRSGMFGIKRKDAKTQRRGAWENFLAAWRLCALALKNDAAPTELKNNLSALATKISRLRRWESALARN
jgi:hypothetical protein